MSAKEIMKLNPVTIRPETTLAEAVLLMCRHQVHNIPVVGDNDAFLGLFNVRCLAHDLLPAAARLPEDSFAVDLGFVSEAPDELIRRFHKLAGRPVSDLIEKEKRPRFCRPETPIPRLLQMIADDPTTLAVVVEEDQHPKVVGMVSTWDVLTRIASNLSSDARPEQSRSTPDSPPPNP